MERIRRNEGARLRGGWRGLRRVMKRKSVWRSWRRGRKRKLKKKTPERAMVCGKKEEKEKRM